MIIMAIVSCSNDTTFHDSKNKAISLSKLKGKWIVVNYWATWCKPCVTEMPELNKLSIKYKNTMTVLGVNFDQLSHQSINEFADKLGVTFSLLSSFPIQKFGITDIGSLPVTFIISPEGKLKETLHGPQTLKSLENIIG